MTKHVTFPTEAAAVAFEAIARKLRGLPIKGEVRGQRFATVSETPGRGWALTYATPRQHPSTGQWSVIVTSDLLEAAADPVARGRLTAGERANVDTILAGAQTRGADWHGSP